MKKFHSVRQLKAGFVCDLLLQYNNVSFQALTAEQAILELNKPCSTMRLTVLNCISSEWAVLLGLMPATDVFML